MKQVFSIAVSALASIASAADIEVAAPFGDNMVLQQKVEIPVWGTGASGATVLVKTPFASVETTVDDNGEWRVVLPARSAGGMPFQMAVASGETTMEFENVLYGDVWISAGQSNMAWPLHKSDDGDLEAATANANNNLRCANRPGSWYEVLPENASELSAVAWHFATTIQRATGVPLGVITMARNSSSVEAWIDRQVLATDGRFGDILDTWEGILQGWDQEEQERIYQQALVKWEASDKTTPAPKKPDNPVMRPQYPGVYYQGRLQPWIGYPIRGVIWYQGEANVAGYKAEGTVTVGSRYADAFTLLIESWRRAWGQEDFPFYWVQLPNIGNTKSDVEDSHWAEVREAQMAALKLPNTGQAVAIDVGEAGIHPSNKMPVGRRLARLALADLHGVNITSRSPVYAKHTTNQGKVVVHFDNVGKDTEWKEETVEGFMLAGPDRVFHKTKGRRIGRATVELTAEGVTEPVAIRYGWADNPGSNVTFGDGLPLTPFRTDTWDAVREK